MIGFANKGNAMKTIKNNFTEGEDYKTIIFRMEKNPNIKNLDGSGSEQTLLFRTEKQKNGGNRGGHNKETVMLNVDTFKNLCMLAKTNRGKSIRRYYVKLENVKFDYLSNLNKIKVCIRGTVN